MGPRPFVGGTSLPRHPTGTATATYGETAVVYETWMEALPVLDVAVEPPRYGLYRPQIGTSGLLTDRPPGRSTLIPSAHQT